MVLALFKGYDKKPSLYKHSHYIHVRVRTIHGLFTLGVLQTEMMYYTDWMTLIEKDCGLRHGLPSFTPLKTNAINWMPIELDVELAVGTQY